MDRYQRMMMRNKASGINQGHQEGDSRKILSQAGIPEQEREAFLKWMVGKMWDTFREERMNQRIMIENEIRSLGLRFPNGTVKKDYVADFRLPVDKIADIEISGAEELGLTLDIEADGECRLSGRPQKAGDFTLILRYRTVDGEPDSEFAIPIAFNPNPRDLWKNIPTDPHVEYYKPDSATEYVGVEAPSDDDTRKDIVAASQRGRSHAQEGKPRDDHFNLYHCEKSDWYIMAVADGAGSAKYSRRGSEIACSTVVDHCKQLLLDNPEFESALHAYAADRDNTDKRTSVTRHVIELTYGGARKAHEAIKRVVDANENMRLKDFATTLMFAVCKKYDFGWFVASFWVGDGAMCLLDTKEKSIKLLGTPDEGEFSGQTRFLTMPEIFRDPEVVKKRVRMTIIPDFTALILMTDGVSDPMFETDRNLNDYNKWEEFYERLASGFPEDEIGGVDLTDESGESAHQLLKWLDFWSPGNHDDRTIAILS